MVESVDVKLPEYFYFKVRDWFPKKFKVIKGKQLLVSIAVEQFDKKLNSLSDIQLKRLEEEYLRQIVGWKTKGIIDKNARGFKGKGV